MVEEEGRRQRLGTASTGQLGSDLSLLGEEFVFIIYATVKHQFSFA